ncbi:29849_t:CDS:2, partial [Racocetra persica]
GTVFTQQIIFSTPVRLARLAHRVKALQKLSFIIELIYISKFLSIGIMNFLDDTIKALVLVLEYT